MLTSFDLVETITKVFGNAPHLVLSIISQYQKTGCIVTMSSQSMADGRVSDGIVRGGPEPEPPTAPP